jgi:hypothetical protein
MNLTAESSKRWYNYILQVNNNIHGSCQYWQDTIYHYDTSEHAFEELKKVRKNAENLFSNSKFRIKK